MLFYCTSNDGIFVTVDVKKLASKISYKQNQFELVLLNWIYKKNPRIKIIVPSYQETSYLKLNKFINNISCFLSIILLCFKSRGITWTRSQIYQTFFVVKRTFLFSDFKLGYFSAKALSSYVTDTLAYHQKSGNV